jgi:hypothetical protein
MYLRRKFFNVFVYFVDPEIFENTKSWQLQVLFKEFVKSPPYSQVSEATGNLFMKNWQANQLPQKDFIMHTSSFQKLFYDVTSAFLNPLNQ